MKSQKWEWNFAFFYGNLPKQKKVWVSLITTAEHIWFVVYGVKYTHSHII